MRVVVIVGLLLTLASPASAGDVDVPSASVSTSSVGGRILGDVFVTNGHVGRIVGVSLVEHCFRVYAAEANWQARRAWELANPEEAAAGEEPPSVIYDHPEVEPEEDPDKRGCAGTSVRLVANPPGEPCPYGYAKGLTGYYAYNIRIRGFEWTGSDEWTDARHAGGDSGVWSTEYVCLELFAGFEDHASFSEILFEPGFAKSPHVTGLTGLETWVWHDFSALVDDLSSVRDGVGDRCAWTISRPFVVDAQGLPLGVVATVWVDAVRWDLDGDGEWDVVADAPDTELEAASHAEYLEVGGGDDPDANAGTFTYLRKDVYPVAVEVEWRGIYEFVNYPGNQGFYDPIVVSSTEDYRVCELVGVLGAGSDGPDNSTCVAP